MNTANIETIVLHVEKDSKNLIISLKAAVNEDPDLNNQYNLFEKRIKTLQEEFYAFGNIVKNLEDVKKNISGVYQNYTERTKSVE